METIEKANEIFNKCCDYADYTDEDCCFTERETMYKNAKHLSLIVVDEIIKVFNFINLNGDDLILLEELKYWKEVKKEIENIEICDNNLLKFPKKYTEKHLKYSYEQGKLVHNPCYSRSFENILKIINNTKCKENQ